MGFLPKMNAALYARVSTRDQKSVPDQLTDLRAYCERQGWYIVREYVETESGTKDTRPVRLEIMRRAWEPNNGLNVVLVWKLDRWGRSLRDLVNTIDDLHRHDVQFVSYSDGLDFTTPSGRLMFHVLAAFAEFEREIIVERTRAGVTKKRARMKEMGHEWGRPAKARAKSVEVLKLAGSGKSQNEIAETLKISRRSVGRILKASKVA